MRLSFIFTLFAENTIYSIWWIKCSDTIWWNYYTVRSWNNMIISFLSSNFAIHFNMSCIHQSGVKSIKKFTCTSRIPQTNKKVSYEAIWAIRETIKPVAPSVTEPLTSPTNKCSFLIGFQSGRIPSIPKCWENDLFNLKCKSYHHFTYTDSYNLFEI